MAAEVYRHPEWKRLFDILASKLEADQFYSYEELQKMAGLDIRSTRGRHQFLRFSYEVLLRLQLHFENVRDQGYRLVKAGEHLECSHRQLQSGRRRIRYARAIAENTRINQLSDGESRALADTLSRLSRLEATMRTEHKAIERNLKQLPSPVPHRLSPPAKSEK